MELKYNLYAIVVHIGLSSTSGHYFCFIRTSPERWHKLDDSKVTFFNLTSLLAFEDEYVALIMELSYFGA